VRALRLKETFLYFLDLSNGHNVRMSSVNHSQLLFSKMIEVIRDLGFFSFIKSLSAEMKSSFTAVITRGKLNFEGNPGKVL